MFNFIKRIKRCQFCELLQFCGILQYSQWTTFRWNGSILLLLSKRQQTLSAFLWFDISIQPLKTSGSIILSFSEIEMHKSDGRVIILNMWKKIVTEHKFLNSVFSLSRKEHRQSFQISYFFFFFLFFFVSSPLFRFPSRDQ